MSIDENQASQMNVTNLELKGEIEGLEKIRDELTATGKYVESYKIKEEIKKLQDYSIIQNLKDFKIKHLGETKQLEENYNNDIANFNEDWNKKLSEFNENSKKVEEILIARHKKDLEDLEESIDKQYDKQIKYSSEYLKCKDAEKKLLKLQDFLQANVMKKRAEALKKEEDIKHNYQKSYTLKLRSPHLISKQQLERENFKKKIQLELEIFEKEKLKNFDELQNRYKNRRSELQMSQKQEESTYLNSSFVRKRFANIKVDNKHKHLNAGNISMQLYPDSSPKKITTNGFATFKNNILPKTEGTIRLDTDGHINTDSDENGERKEGDDGNINTEENQEEKPEGDGGEEKPAEDEGVKEGDGDEKPAEDDDGDAKEKEDDGEKEEKEEKEDEDGDKKSENEDEEKEKEDEDD